jgi:glycosyltransferase involved in cell wall biosynthesis
MPPRLLFINRYAWPDESATAQMLTDLSEGLAARGRVVTVVTSRQRLDDPRADLPAREARNGVQVIRAWTTRFGRGNLAGRLIDYLSFYVSAFIAVLAHARAGDLVIAKTDPPMLGAVIGPAAWLKRAALINWWQDVYPEIAVRLGVLREGSLLVHLLLWVRNRLLRHARLNVVVGERMRAHLEAAAPGAAFAVIPNWSADLPHTAVPSPDNPLRREIGAGDKVLFMYSGNLGRAHPFDALLEAGERLRERRDLHFLIVGGGARLEQVRNEAAKRGLRNWSFLPYQPRERLAESLGAADVHLVTLDPAVEGLIVPSKIYGVLAAGRPSVFVGAASGEVAQVIEKHGCGRPAPHDDAAAIQRVIEQLAADPARRRDMGQRARNAFETAFTPTHAMQRWMEAGFV